MKNSIKEHFAQAVVVAIIIVFALLCVFYNPNQKSAARSMGAMPGAGGAPSGAPSGTGGAGAQGAQNARGANGAQADARANGTNSAQVPANTITVSAKKITPETIQQRIKLNGDVETTSNMSAYAITSGKVTRILVSEGDSVKKGDVIAYIDPSKPGASYAASPITAPASGTVLQVNVQKGDSVTTSSAIATVGSLTDLYVNVAVAEKYALYLQKGLSADISFVSSDGEKFGAFVSSISPVVAKTSRTIKTTLQFAKVDERIKPGMFANVDLVINQKTNAFVVPKDAIKTYNDDECVFVISANNTAQRVLVTTGLSNDTDIEVTSGLQEGMTVITAGSVTEGSPVRIANAQ